MLTDHTSIAVVGIRNLNMPINISHLVDQILRGVGICADTIHLLYSAEVTRSILPFRDITIPNGSLGSTHALTRSIVRISLSRA